jgi:UDP-glucose 4-epimerase
MKILITGGAGFIGSHTAETLVANGHEVRIFDNLSAGTKQNLQPLGPRAELIEGDVRDGEALRQAMCGCHAVLHLAALVSRCEALQRPQLVHEVNATGTLGVLEAARALGIRRVVLGSSAAVYGANPEPTLSEDAALQPLSPDAAQLVLGEMYGSVYAYQHGMQPIALRYFNVFGPRQQPSSPGAGVLSRFVAAALQGRPATIFGDGRQTRDFVYVKDVAQANLRALLAPEECAGCAINVASGRAVSVLGAFQQVARLADLPAGVEPVHAAPRQGDLRHCQASILRARQLLGYRPAVSFAEGLALTLAWARQAFDRSAPLVPSLEAAR